MGYDAKGILSENQSLISEEATVNSTNTIDLGSGGYKGDGEPLMIEYSIGTAGVGASATLQILVEDSADDGAGAPASFRTILSTRAFGIAELVADSDGLVKIFLPAGPQGVRRHVRTSYVVAAAHITAGTITALLRPYKG